MTLEEEAQGDWWYRLMIKGTISITPSLERPEDSQKDSPNFWLELTEAVSGEALGVDEIEKLQKPATRILIRKSYRVTAVFFSTVCLHVDFSRILDFTLV